MKVLQINNYFELLQSDLVISIDGKVANTESSFLEQIYDRLYFSDPNYMNWDAYLDWMKDLSWITERNITIFIYNWDEFLRESDKIDKMTFISDYEDDIFPFWEEEKKEYPDDNAVKNIKVCYSSEGKETLLNNIELIEMNAAIYYARGYMNRLFQMDVIAGFEKDGQWIFTGGDKEKNVFGNPRILITRDNNVSSFNKTIKELINYSRDAQAIEI